MIHLNGVTKIYKNNDSPAVNNLDLHITRGETCILVGPSGCGKTTTMKMINRLVTPTQGTILIDGQDNREMNPVELRQNIGYVIQEIGLFPHMSIADNVATVPREKKWPEKKIQTRVDELLHLVGLDPAEYRKRKPASLSGGQRQRVGVARALAADPDILLMDEPFGAVDPITRTHLQNQFIRLQEELKKTVVFVTHDIDEAIKMGDTIAVMREGHLIQLDSPDQILSEPKNDFVSALIGGNRAIKRLNLVKTREVIDNKPIQTLKPDSPVDTARELLLTSQLPAVPVVDDNNRLIGVVHKHVLSALKDQAEIADVLEKDGCVVDTGATLGDALSTMLNYGERYVIIVDENNSPCGIISFTYLLELMKNDAA